ncbi:Putative universal stress protein [Nocardia cyriacigeorgica GUH-2]|nr:Putative universal stress protein [Nocardia cyriacigeorgica GUH-2]
MVLVVQVRMPCRPAPTEGTLKGMSEITTASYVPDGPTKRHVVVGVDGSSTAIRAAHWAAVEADARQVPLLLVHVARRHACAPEGADMLEFTRQAIVERWAQTSRTAPPSITALTLRGNPATKLIELSTTAELLVIGSVGRSSGARALLGSVATDLAAESRCPVAVIRPLQSGASAVGPILVVTEPALAGSPNAVAEAFQAAADRHSEVLVVDIARPTTWASSGRAIQHHAESWLDEQRRCHPAVPVRVVTYLGHPRTAIEKFSVTAQLVVVGRTLKQHWPHLTDAMRTALCHTRCAVLIVPDGDPRTQQSPAPPTAIPARA